MAHISRIFCYLVVIADLFAIVLFGGRYITTGSVFPHEAEAKPLFPDMMIEGDGPQVASAPKKEETLPEGFVASAEKGAKVAAKCKTCHTFDQGGDHRTGPNLYGIMDMGIAHHADFSYSAALTAKKGEVVWDDASMDAWLKKPKSFIDGNKMAFGGLRSIEDRAHMIAYLRSLK